uniref:Uncharacterized protein n=1 Tax=Caenorhabditis tropicalis TaxID=1561998 RepID=A0A1I7U3W3_9PELO
MAFYFALLNVSKNDSNQEKQTSSHRKHRRHSIASVESPLLNYRLLPRPQLLTDDVVITNEHAHQAESSSSGQQPPRLSDRRSRGSARASKWVQDNLTARGAPKKGAEPPVERSGREPRRPKPPKPPQIPVPKRELLQAPSSSNPKYSSPPVTGTRKPMFQVMGSATDESGRSSSQMSNESTTPRRDDSPASSCDPREVTMKLSGISMSSRSSEPRLKKVTFESSPYVISNSFLGDGAGKVLVVRRGSGTAVRRVGAWKGRTNEVVSGDDWWQHCGKGDEDEAITDNQLNKCLEKDSGTRSILRRGLIRRRSTSDKSRLLAYRNTGFLSSSQERKSESTSTSRMTVSVDRPKYK